MDRSQISKRGPVLTNFLKQNGSTDTRSRQNLIPVKRCRGVVTMLEDRVLFLVTLRLMDPGTKRGGSPTTSSGSEKADHEEVRRKKNRRGKHHRRKWKPYSRMTAEEKKQVDEREAARAARREAELAGKPAAPWNTTQFIMADHGCSELHIRAPRMSRTMSIESSGLSGDELYESPEEEIMEHGLFLEQDFESAYQEMASESLQGMTKTELVQQCLDLEEEVTLIRDQLREECNSKMVDLQREIATLRSQNRTLQEENERLKLTGQPQVVES